MMRRFTILLFFLFSLLNSADAQLLLANDLLISQNATSDDTNGQGQQAILVIGDSFTKGSNDDTGPGPTPTAGTSFYYRSSNNTVIEIGANDLEFARNPPTDGSPWPQLAIDFNTITSRKAVIIPCGFGASTFAPNGDNNNWSTTGDNYAIAVGDAGNCMSLLGVTKLKAIIIILGINDARNAVSLATIQSDVASLITRLQTDFPDTDILVVQIGRSETAMGNDRIYAVRQYLKTACIDNDRVFMIGGLLGAPAAGLVSADNIHLSQTGNNAIGQILARWFQNDTYSKWARSVICSHYDDLSTLRKDLIADVIDNNLSDYLIHEALFNYKTTISANVFHDWAFFNVTNNVGTISFTANSHVSSNGTSTFMRPGLAQSINTYVSTQNDYFESVKIKVNNTAAGTGAIVLGAIDGGSTIATQLGQTSGSLLVYRVNDVTATTSNSETKLNGDAEYLIARNGTSKFLYKNAVQVHTAVVSSTGLNSVSQNLGSNNSNGTAASFINAEYEYLRAGKFVGMDQSAMYNSMETLVDNWNN
jgi:hypothetical protein